MDKPSRTVGRGARLRRALALDRLQRAHVMKALESRAAAFSLRSALKVRMGWVWVSG
jgi:hypothetical protein